jgi:YHS domain-containing protein
MVRFLLYVLEFVVATLFFRGLSRSLRAGSGGPRIHFWKSRGGSGPRQPEDAHRGEMVRDPVCGMFVSTEVSHRLTRGKETLHFCSRECLEQYQKDVAHVAS